eukprot:12782885-Ditylum_brightwellii.AAC.1
MRKAATTAASKTNQNRILNSSTPKSTAAPRPSLIPKTSLTPSLRVLEDITRAMMPSPAPNDGAITL